MSMLGMGGMLSRSALSGLLTTGHLAVEAVAAGADFSPLDLQAMADVSDCTRPISLPLYRTLMRPAAA